jgi:hypothetical protein
MPSYHRLGIFYVFLATLRHYFGGHILTTLVTYWYSQLTLLQGICI